MYWAFVGMYRDEDWIFAQGYRDAKEHLLPRLRDEFGVAPAPAAQPRSTDTHPAIAQIGLRFDHETNSFPPKCLPAPSSQPT